MPLSGRGGARATLDRKGSIPPPRSAPAGGYPAAHDGSHNPGEVSRDRVSARADPSLARACRVRPLAGPLADLKFLPRVVAGAVRTVDGAEPFAQQDIPLQLAQVVLAHEGQIAAASTDGVRQLIAQGQDPLVLGAGPVA